MMRIFAMLLVLTTVSHPAWAIVTSDAPGSHIVTPGQAAFGLNLDGVAMIGGLLFGEPVSFCTGALISDSHVLCAAHCFDVDEDGQLESLLAPFGIADTVMFETAGGLVAIAYDAQSVQVPSDWPVLPADIAVITLAQDAPAEVPRYALYGGTDDVGRIAVLTGYGDSGHGSTGVEFLFDPSPTKRAGLNRIELLDQESGVAALAADFDSGLAQNNTIALAGFESDLGFGADEVGLAPGDSGGPLFINGLIAGVNLAAGQPFIGDVNELADASWGELSIALRVSSYRSFIVAATRGTAVFVPEPGAFPALSLATLPLIYRRRRGV